MDEAAYDRIAGWIDVILRTALEAESNLATAERQVAAAIGLMLGSYPIYPDIIDAPTSD